MGREILFVDGYNVIYAWDELAAISEESFPDARERLSDILSNYQGLKGNEVILVFDGHLVKGGTGSVETVGNIKVVFTREGETADGYIERMVGAAPPGYHIRVATSDALEQIMIMGRGAERVSSKELLAEIKSLERKMRTSYIEKKPPKNNMLADNLDEKTQEWFEKMRRSGK